MLDAFVERGLRYIVDLGLSTHEERAIVLSHVLVPAVLIVVMATSLFGFGLAAAPEEVVTVFPLRSVKTSAGDVAEHEGVSLVVEPEPFELALPWKGSSNQVRTSIEPGKIELLGDSLKLERGFIRLELPFLGVSEPVMLSLSGQAGPTATVMSRSLPMAQLGPISRRSRSVTNWMLLAVVFGFGLFVQTTPSGLAAVGKHEASKKG